jgi:hypothetical protein
VQQPQALIQRPGGGGARLRLCGLVLALSTGLASSTYQSQNTFQMKRYSAVAASSKAQASSARVTVAAVFTVSPRIQRFRVD